MFCRILVFLSLFLSLNHAFSISLNNGKDSGNPYYIVHLENDREFLCQIKVGQDFYPADAKIGGAVHNEGREYHCFIEGKLTQTFSDQYLPFMDLYIKPAKDGFNIIIKPKTSSRLLSIDDSLFQSTGSAQKSKGDKSKHYSIIIDDKTAIALSQTRPELDFSIIYPNLQLPNIGALDFNKDPLTTQREGDISEYLTIKNLYSQDKFEEVIEIADGAIKDYPNSVFFSEYKLYLVRSLFGANAQQKENAGLGSIKKDFNTRLLGEAKSWVRNFASDKAYAEVLFMLMQSQLDNDDRDDARYTLDLLMTEHEKSPWTKKGILGFADNMYANDRALDAIRLYEDVLYMTDEMGTASLAAMRLAATHLKLNEKEKARFFLQKILDANQAYLAQNKAKALSLANSFRENEMPIEANKIYKIVFEASSKKDPEYESSLRQLALSHAGNENSDDTYSYLMLYKVDFPTSEYISLINTALDRMFFNVDLNQTSSALHAAYTDLMEKYRGNDIGNRALKEEIKLSLKEGAYKQVLVLKESIRDTNDTETKGILTTAAAALANEQNQKGECAMLMLLIDEYEIEKNVKDRYKLFSCYMRQARFSKALETTTKGVESGDLHTRVEWLSNAAAAHYALGEFDKALKAADDAIYEAKRIAYADPSRAIYSRFYSLLRLNRLDEALATASMLENVRGAHFMLIELYDAAAKYAAANNLDSAALSYAKKTIEMQKQLKISTYSPEIDFIYIDTLRRMGDENTALEALLALLKTGLKDEIKTRALYQAAEIEMKKGLIASAKDHVKACLDTNSTSPWKALCKEQNELLNE